MAGFVNPWTSGGDQSSQSSSGGFVNPWSSMPSSSPNDNSSTFQLTPDDLKGLSPSTATPQQDNSGTGWNGIIDNPIGRGVGGVLGFLGQKFDQFEHATGLNHVAGAMKGLVNPFMEPSSDPAPTNLLDSYLSTAKGIGHGIANMLPSAYQGFMHPDEMQKTLEQNTQGLSPADKFVIAAGTDPLSYVPIGAIGKGISKASDIVGLTPYVTKGMNAVKASPVVNNPLVNGTKNVLGNAFVKNYGASPEISSILQAADGEKAFHQVNNLGALKDLQQGHGLTPDQLNDIGHVTEQTIPGIPEQQALAKQLSDLLENGSANSGVGSNLLSHTASAVNGDPLLAAKIPNYFPHIYNNVPDELKGVFPRKADGVGGLSPNGTYNQPRTFSTLQDAIQQGLKPELNPFLATGQRLDEMSKAYVNNKIIQQIKNTPGLLFDKDPIDEVSKLVKTGRMDATGAANQLGMSADDLKKGFVQSQIPQLRGAYIRPADEAALTEYLNPSRPTGIMGAINSANNLYNKGFLLNPLPHLHNVVTNGVGLGGANTSYIKDTLDALKSGQPDQWYLRAVKSGAVNNPIEGKFTDAITRQAPTNPFSKLGKAGHDLLWNTDASIRTALFRDAIENGMTDAQAAAHTNKYMVNYNDLTPFEKTVMKPLIPFYSWKKGNIPLQISQTFQQTPKYVAWDHAKNAISQELSGQPTDQKGRIMTGEKLADGSQVALDPYSPMDEPGKIAEKGVIPWAFNSMNPFLREAIAQGTSAAGAFFPQTGLQNKFSIYNSGAPAEYNWQKGLSHAATNLNPLGSSITGGVADNAFGNNITQRLFGLPTKDNNTPALTWSEGITKALGGFTGRDNPAKDVRNQQYQQQDNLKGQIKYMKETGQPVPKSMTRAAYKKVK